MTERRVGAIKQVRRVTTRDNKLAPHRLAFVQLAFEAVRLRGFGNPL